MKALGMVFGCFLGSLAIAAVLHPMFHDAGGALKFFSETMILGIYAAVLAVAYYAGRPKKASGGGAPGAAQVRAA